MVAVSISANSTLTETAELVLVLKREQLQLIATYHEENRDNRFGMLATVARRLAESLHVPLNRPDDTVSLGMTDQQLAEKYIEQGGQMEMRAKCIETDGKRTSAEQYREEAMFLYQYAHELDPDHNEPLLALGRLAGDDDLHRRAVEIAVGENEDDVDALLARAQLHHGEGNVDLFLADLGRAIELEPSARTLHERAVVLFFQG